MLSCACMKTEVNLRNVTAGDRKLMEAAHDKAVYQWISNSVFKNARIAGAPITCIMAMMWILAWKEAPEGTQAKSRLVAKGFTDPDLLTIRAEAPTLAQSADIAPYNWLVPMHSNLKSETPLQPSSKAILRNIIGAHAWNILQIS